MSAIKDGRMPVELNGKTYYLLFSLNALDEMQDRFGGYDKLDKAFDQSNPTMIKDLRWLLTLIINEGMEEGETPLTEQQVGKFISAICRRLKTLFSLLLYIPQTAGKRKRQQTERQTQQKRETE